MKKFPIALWGSPSNQGLGFHLTNHNEREFCLIDKAIDMKNDVRLWTQTRKKDNLQNREEEKGSRIHRRCSNKR